MNTKKKTIEQLFQAYYAELHQQACQLLHDPEESKDAVSEVFAKLLQADELPAPDNMRGYLATAVRNRCLDIIEHRQVRQRAEREFPATDTVAADTADASEEQHYRDLRQYVDTSLPEQARRVFLLRFDKHKKFQEIAAELSVSEKTVYKHMNHAVATLHKRFHYVVLIVLLLSAMAYAAVRIVQYLSSADVPQVPPATETVATPDQHQSEEEETCVFENAELKDILSEVAAYYHLQVQYLNEKSLHLRIYTKWNKSEDAQTIIDKLNRFDKVDVTLAPPHIIVK